MQPSFISLQSGSKVECIKDCDEWCCHMKGCGPKKGQTFTVAGFENTFDGEPGIHLKEVSIEPCGSLIITSGFMTIINFGGQNSVSWPIVNFRPLIEDKTEKEDHVEKLKQMARDIGDKNKTPFEELEEAMQIMTGCG